MSWSSSRFGGHRLLAAARAAAVVLAAGSAIVVPAASASAAVTTIYASPSGTGSACSSAQPCSLSAAQAAVRSQVASMSGDIIVQLADGVYRPAAPLKFTSADSGSGGHTVSWQAAPSAHPVITGAKAVTGWSLADSSKNIWKASIGAGVDTRQLYVGGVEATRARTTVNRSDFTAKRHRAEVHRLLPELPEQPGAPEPRRDRGRRLVHRPVLTGAEHRQRPADDAATGLGQQRVRVRHPHQPVPCRSPVPGERLRVPRLARRVVRRHLHRRLVLHPAVRAEHEQHRRGVPAAPVPRGRRRHLRLPRARHLLLRHHLHRDELVGPQRLPGVRRPADRRLSQRELVLALVRLLPIRLLPVRGRPAALEPDARSRTGLRGRPHHLQRRPVRQPRPDRAGHRQ